jgi:hypothetical protein
MSQADRIRETAIESYILPARAAGKADVIIRAGDLHGEMKLKNAMPAVCSALGSGKFELLAGVKRLEITGPANGANVYFRFDIAAPVGELAPRVQKHRSQPSPRPVDRAKAATATIDLGDALVLVSCVKSKLPHVAPARMLYCSDWFTKVREIVDAQGARWFVLSALYGLVPADKEIAPYDHTLNTVGVAARRVWADGVYRALLPELKGHKRIVFFAGLKYREFLVEPLQKAGFQIEVPMEGLVRGDQLSWLTARP